MSLALTVTFLASIAVIAFGLWRWRVASRLYYARSLVEDTLTVTRTLLILAQHLQQHRGMSLALLSGEAGFTHRLREKQEQVDALFPVLRRALRAESVQGRPCLNANEVSRFRFRWQTLREQLGELRPEQSFAQHGFMIARVLQWLALLGGVRIEPLVGAHLRLGVVRNYVSRLPQLAETLGQARAIGTGVAARHACTPLHRVRLMFLLSRAEALLEQAEAAEGRSAMSADVRLATQEMARKLRTGLLLNHGISVTPTAYFEVATRAIDAVYAWASCCAHEISRAALKVELDLDAGAAIFPEGGA